MKVKYILILVGFLVIGCGPKKGINTKKKNESNKTETVVDTKKESSEPDEKEVVITPNKDLSSVEVYINTYSAIAMREMRKSKIPASITLAQGILESGSGKGRLAVKANNHFGIKCHGWKGAKIYHDDDHSQECFRKYPKAELSYGDHSEFLTGRKRYANLFKLKSDDYKGWAKGLKAAGYATDKKYPQKLISLIERYKLYEFDNKVLNGSDEKQIYVNSGYFQYIVEKGDTLYALAKRYNTTVEAIKDLNNMTTTSIALGQELKIPN